MSDTVPSKAGWIDLINESVHTSDDMKKHEKLQSRGQHDKELSKGAESERERSTKRPGTGAR